MTAMMDKVSVSSIIGQGKVNQLGGHYINGRPLNHGVRAAIVELFRQGEKPCNISRSLKVSHGAVSKILHRYQHTGSIQPGQMGGTARTRKTVNHFEKEIRALRDANPDIQPKEIRAHLIKLGKCTPEEAPTENSIARRLTMHRRSLLMEKRRRQRPATSPENVAFADAGKPEGAGAIPHSIQHILGAATSSTSATTAAGDAGAGSSAVVSENHDETWLDDEDGSASAKGENRRNRTAFTTEQIKLLEQKFDANMYPDEQEKQVIIEATGLDLNRINTWFSNRRARVRKSLPLAANGGGTVPCSTTTAASVSVSAFPSPPTPFLGLSNAITASPLPFLPFGTGGTGLSGGVPDMFAPPLFAPAPMFPLNLNLNPQTAMMLLARLQEQMKADQVGGGPMAMGVHGPSSPPQTSPLLSKDLSYSNRIIKDDT